MAWIKRKTANPISLGGVILLIVCLFLPFHRLGWGGEAESVFDTVTTETAEGRILFDATERLTLATLPNVFALYMLVMFLLLAFIKGDWLDSFASHLNFLFAFGLFLGLFRFLIKYFTRILR